jgi:hypothetical protein
VIVVAQALEARWPQSRRRGRSGTAAEGALSALNHARSFGSIVMRR